MSQNPKLLNGKYAFAVLSASVGSGFQNGYHYGLINVGHTTIEKWFIATKFQTSKSLPTDTERMMNWLVLTTVFAVGGMFGSSLTASWANIFGHKGGLMWNNLLQFTAILFIYVAEYTKLYEMFVMGRFCLGFHVGLSSALCPMYLSEIAPFNLRGSTTAMYSFYLTLSFCLSQIFALHFGGPQVWVDSLIFATIPSILQIPLLWFCPESPRYLLIDLNDEIQSKKALIWFRNSEDVDDEIDFIRDHRRMLSRLPKVSLKTFFTESVYRSPLLISLTMMICQQTCGMEIIMNYSTTLMERAGISQERAKIPTVLMGVFFLIMTLVCVFLIDVFGRRNLFLISLCGLIMTTIFLTVMLQIMRQEALYTYRTNSVAVGVVLLGFWYGLGTGTIPSVITVEVFHQTARPVAVSIVVSVSWLVKSMVNMTYLPIEKKVGPYVFVIYISMDLLLFLFIQIFLPETKGKSSKQIIQLFYNLFSERSTAEGLAAF